MSRRSSSKQTKRKVVLELGLEGKFAAKSTGWDENRVFLEGDKLEVVVKNGRWVRTHLTRSPRPAAELLRHYFLKRRCNGGDAITETANRRNAVTLADRGGAHVVMKRLTACPC